MIETIKRISLFFLLSCVVLPIGAQAFSTVISQPVNGQVVPKGFLVQWNAVSTATGYTVTVGATIGGSDLFSATTTAASAYVQVSQTGAAFLRLTTLGGDGSPPTDVNITVSDQPYVTAPVNGATSVDPTYPVTFSWTTVPDAQAYYLYVGTAAGLQDVYGSGETLAASKAVTLGPQTQYFVRIWVKRAGIWTYADSLVSTGLNNAVLQNPGNNQNVSADIIFRWLPVPSATSYALWIGSSAGTQDAGAFNTASTSVTAVLRPTQTYYARLWTYRGSNATYTDSSFNTTDQPVITSPPDGSTGVDPTFAVPIQWTGVAGPTTYTLWLGSQPGKSDVLVYNTLATQVFVTLQPVKSYYARLFLLRNGVWSSVDSSFTTGSTSPLAHLSQPVNGSVVPANNISFTWNSVAGASYVLNIGTTFGGSDVRQVQTTGTSLALNLPPGATYYVRLATQGGPAPGYTDSTFSTASPPVLLQPAYGATNADASQPVQFTWSSVPSPQAYYLYVGTQPGTKNVYETYETLATSATAALNANTKYYTRLWLKQNNAWTYTDSVFTTRQYGAILLTPANGASVSYSPVNFTWTPETGAISYSVWIGTAPGLKDVTSLFTSGTSLSAILDPGKTYYDRLWTQRSTGWFYHDYTFSTDLKSQLVYPAQGQLIQDPHSVTITWKTAAGVTNRLILGTSAGDSSIFDSGNISATSATMTLPISTTIYARLFTVFNGSTVFTDSTFSTGIGLGAVLLTPANGATVPSHVSFAWMAETGATYYSVWIGTSLGQKDVASLFTSGTSVSTILDPGKTYYDRLWTQGPTGWFYHDYTFSTAIQSQLVYPAQGQLIQDPHSVTLTWRAAAGVTNRLILGTSAGDSSVFDSGNSSATSATTALPPSTTIYARLFTVFNGTTVFADSTFSTGPGYAYLTYPLNQATGVDLFPVFTWNSVSDAQSYYISVSPTGFGNNDGLSMGNFIPSVLSRQSWGLQPNMLYYAQICTHKAGTGLCTNSTFTTTGASPLPSDQQGFYQQVNTLVGQVRTMTVGTSNTAQPGTLLYQEDVTTSRDPTLTTCGYYAWALLDLLGQNRILARRRDITLVGIDGHVLVEFWDPFNQKWSTIDPTFGYVYYDALVNQYKTVEELGALLQQGSYSSMQPTYVTSYGSLVATQYYLDPITMFNNIHPIGPAAFTWLVPPVNSPVPYMNVVPDPNAQQGKYGTYMFSFPSTSDSASIYNNGNTLITLLPNAGTYTSFTTLINWRFASPLSGGATMYTPKRLIF